MFFCQTNRGSPCNPTDTSIIWVKICKSRDVVYGFGSSAQAGVLMIVPTPLASVVVGCLREGTGRCSSPLRPSLREAQRDDQQEDAIRVSGFHPSLAQIAFLLVIVQKLRLIAANTNVTRGDLAATSSDRSSSLEQPVGAGEISRPNRDTAPMTMGHLACYACIQSMPKQEAAGAVTSGQTCSIVSNHRTRKNIGRK